MAGRTDPGRVRSNNEDSYTTVPELGLALLADGMGGHLAGEVASAMAVETITNALVEMFASKPPIDDASTGAHETHALAEAIRRANAAIHAAARARPECAGMGCTLVVGLFFDNRVCIAHVGDSRLYRFRGGQLEPLTEDHSLIQELVRRGFVSADEARASYNKNVVTRALGVDPDVQVDLREERLKDGDLYLLCSDGLTDVLTDVEIEAALRTRSDDLDGTLEHLVAAANDRGGPDNVSVVLVRTGKRIPRNKKAIQQLRLQHGQTDTQI